MISSVLKNEFSQNSVCFSIGALRRTSALNTDFSRRHLCQNPPALAGGRLIAYVLLKFLHTEGHKKNNCKRLSFAGFTRQLLCATLPIEWRIGLKELLTFHGELYQIHTG